jgi:hypothetical protein
MRELNAFTVNTTNGIPYVDTQSVGERAVSKTRPTVSRPLLGPRNGMTK